MCAQSKAPCWSSVAALTCREVIAAKRALAVVTSHATLATSSRMMVERFRRCHLPPLRLTSADIVTFVTVHLFMLCVAETDAERRHHRRGARIAPKLMTRAARRNVAATRLRPRRVTTETSRMRVEVSRYRHRDAAASRPMTRSAIYASHAYVPRVIEFHSETHQSRRKRLRRPGLRISVADCADRTIGRRKLLRVTSGARKMLRRSRPFRHGRIRISSMTQQTRKTRVIATVVLKF